MIKQLCKYSILVVLVLLAESCGVRNTTGSALSPQGPKAAATQSGSVSTLVRAIVNGCDNGATPFGGGDGSSATPYLICSIPQLNQVANNTYAKSNFQLVADLDATGLVLFQIGTFAGLFDGMHHSVSNWTGIGPLFEDLSGTLQNFSLLNVNISGSWRMGLVGTAETSAQVINCNVQGTVYGPYMAGGLVGLNKGQVSNSSAEVNISGNDHIGGLVGVNLGGITNSTSSGSLVLGTLNPETGQGLYGLYFGGLVGLNDNGGTITHCNSTSAVTAVSNVGGLVGQTASGTVVKSFATGTITGSGASVGGLIGSNAGGVSNSYTSGSVQGASSVGGLVGVNSSNINNTYSVGSVTGSGSNIGGLVGQQSAGTVSSSYWNAVTSGQSSSAAGTSENTAAMQSSGTFAGWDFAGTWSLSAGAYPVIK